MSIAKRIMKDRMSVDGMLKIAKKLCKEDVSHIACIPAFNFDDGSTISYDPDIKRILASWYEYDIYKTEEEYI